MSEKKENTIDGLPWTKPKVNKILSNLKIGGAISFAFGFDELKYLQILNEEIFSKRDDIVLHIWSVAENKILTKNELEELTKVSFLKRLKISGFKNNSLIELQDMKHIEELALLPMKKLNILFIQNFEKLKKISLYGVENLDVLENNTNLEYLYLHTTVNSYDFARKLTQLKKIIIDSCISTNDFSSLNQLSLEYLGIHSVKNLENIDSISSFSTIKEFHLDASRIKILPSFKNLKELQILSLRYMKIWENPNVLKDIPNLEELELMEINTKLKAEDFFFLKDMNSLKSLDFRFVDFNKARIEKLYKYFKENNLENIVKS